jgi:hypothetical protein
LLRIRLQRGVHRPRHHPEHRARSFVLTTRTARRRRRCHRRRRRLRGS